MENAIVGKSPIVEMAKTKILVVGPELMDLQNFFRRGGLSRRLPQNAAVHILLTNKENH